MYDKIAVDTTYLGQAQALQNFEKIGRVTRRGVIWKRTFNSVLMGKR